MTMTRDEVLAVPPDRPEAVFPGDPDEAKSLYRELSKRWHPDRPGGAADVFAYIAALYRTAGERLASGTWRGPAVVSLLERTGKTFTFKADVNESTPVGRVLIGADGIAHVIEARHRQYAAHGTEAIFSYASARMREECERYVPKVTYTSVLDDGRYLVVVQKTRDLVRLRDLVNVSGRIDAVHVAWIVSSILNLACFLNFTKIVHLDISPETYFVSPRYHSGALLSGWWFWRRVGSPMTVVPRRTRDLMPFRSAMTRLASPSIDGELIRATALDVLAPGAPAPMVKWLSTPNSAPPVDQYSQWRDILKLSFGERRFIELPVTADVVYGRGITPKGR